MIFSTGLLSNGIPIEQEYKKEMVEMCNLGEGILEEGIEQGIEHGMGLKTIAIIRKKRCKGISPEDCADILEEDIRYVRRIYDLMESNPDADDREIMEMTGCDTN